MEKSVDVNFTSIAINLANRFNKNRSEKRFLVHKPNQKYLETVVGFKKLIFDMDAENTTVPADL